MRGVKGMSCLDLTRDLEAALGGKILDRQLTPEAVELPSGEDLHQQIAGN